MKLLISDNVIYQLLSVSFVLIVGIVLRLISNKKLSRNNCLKEHTTHLISKYIMTQLPSSQARTY